MRSFFESLNMALVVGGSITIPHMRRAVETLDQCREKTEKTRIHQTLGAQLQKASDCEKKETLILVPRNSFRNRSCLFFSNPHQIYKSGEPQFDFELSISGEIVWMFFWQSGCCMLHEYRSKSSETARNFDTS